MYVKYILRKKFCSEGFILTGGVNLHKNQIKKLSYRCLPQLQWLFSPQNFFLNKLCSVIHTHVVRTSKQDWLSINKGVSIKKYLFKFEMWYMVKLKRQKFREKILEFVFIIERLWNIIPVDKNPMKSNIHLYSQCKTINLYLNLVVITSPISLVKMFSLLKVHLFFRYK